MATAGKADPITGESVARATVTMRRLPARLWAARGFFGGLAAFGVTAYAQQTLLANNDPDTALRYYAAATLILIAALLHPALPRHGWLRRGRKSDAAPASTPGHDTATALMPEGAGERSSTLPTRTARTNTEPLQSSTKIAGAWARWKTVRAEMGWRVTAPGLALTLALVGASALLLSKDITAPTGGWLWAAALLMLLVTFIGAPGWPRGAGPMPGPRADFFGRGIPQIPVRWEAGLMAVVLMVALAMRLANLEYLPGIFGDEGERGMDARAINEGRQTLLFGYGWWQVPNMYFYLVSFFLRIFGNNMVGDRMLSVISGVLAVWFVYRTARLLWGVRAGLIAGALLAVSPVALQFSREAGESTPTGALWAAGFYFLCMALRHRRWSDWVLSGIAWGFSLYFYAAGKLVIPLIAAAGLYCLVRWRRDFFRHYALGFLLLGFAFVLTFMPYGIFSYQDQWQGFTGRAQETSIFSPQNAAGIFERYGIPYDAAAATQPLVQQLLSHLLPWAQVLFNQMRVTTEVLYRSGDPTFFYKNTAHAGSLLSPLLAALALMGLAYGTWKFWDGRFGLLGIWFWVGMLGPALTTDTPSVQRITGAWPALMIFPAVVLDRVLAAGWPLSLRMARRWVAVPVAALLIFFAVEGYQDYFVTYAATCPFCDASAQARYAVALGQDYKAYQMGVGGYDVFFTYGPTRFLAKDVEGADLSVPAEFFPVTDNNGKGAAFIVYNANYDYLPIIRLFYPGGKEEVIKSADDVERFTSYKVTREQMANFQALHATYKSPSGSRVERVEPGLGTAPFSGEWTPPPGLAYPSSATWSGGLVAPSYGAYTFQVSGTGDAKLEIDGRAIYDEAHPASPAGNAQEVVLAKGIHDVRLTGTLRDAGSRVDVTWLAQGGAPAHIPPQYLYDGTTGSLSGEVGALTTADDVKAADPLGGQAPTARRSETVFGFRMANDVFGGAPFIVRWQGSIQASTAGSYTFETSSNGPSALFVDGNPVVDNPANGNMAQATGAVTLDPGPHKVDLRYAWQTGSPSRFEWFWTPPGGERALVPATALRPLTRSWLRGELPDAPTAEVQQPQPTTTPIVAPDAVIGGDAGLVKARGVAVDGAGNIYVGDRGNGRVVLFSPQGKVLRSVGKLAPAPSSPAGGAPTPAPAPGEFVEIGDVAVTQDGSALFVIDTIANQLHVFDSSGKVIRVVDAATLQTMSPNGLGIAPDGSVYVADTAHSRLVKLPPSVGTAGKGGVDSPAELQQGISFIDGTGTGGVAGGTSGTSGRYEKIEQAVDVVVPSVPVAPAAPVTSTNTTTTTGTPTTAEAGGYYGIDLRNRIMQLSAEGVIERQWKVEVGTDDGGSRLAMSPDGERIYMSDPDHQRVAILDVATGEITYLGSPGQFGAPSGVATGPDGRIYVLDRAKGNIQVFTLKK